VRRHPYPPHPQTAKADFSHSHTNTGEELFGVDGNEKKKVQAIRWQAAGESVLGMCEEEFE
jgi:hypothetical protein